jgi:REP element-mobilizing transposase RayT
MTNSDEPQRADKPGHHALRRGRVSLPHQVYLVTTPTWQRQPVFLDFQAACVAARCFEDSGLLGDARMLAWVLMPDHVHWLVQVGAQDSLSTVVNRLKSASGRQVNRLLGKQGPLWQKAFHDHALRAEEEVRTMARSMVANPLRAGLVQRMGDYPFWNAMWV